MVKILSQTGMSLADIYDIKGSIAGVDQLISNEVTLSHEMGATIFSERFQTTFRRTTTPGLAQNLSWDIVFTDLPDFVTRVLAVSVIANAAARVSTANVSLRDPVAERELPIWAWDAGVDEELTVRIQENADPIQNLTMLRPRVKLDMPSMLTGASQAQRIPDISFRGTTLGFGAGTVTTIVLIYLGFTHIGASGISSFGLPVPSW